MKSVMGIFIVLLLAVTSATVVTAASTEDCKACHPGKYDAWTASPHYIESVLSSDNPNVESCLPCHGASTARLYIK
ncbi:hypothetical protein [Methanolobus sp. ZRKC5]|uniref:hypothetical protein n=1 Tax=unclassified Methanolobus TaxID=2629569 RepID=UPI00313DBCFE